MAEFNRILVTGGAGFIGSAFIRYMLREHDDVQILNLDKLTYAGNLENLESVKLNSNYRFYRGDICSDADVADAFAAADDSFGGPMDAVVHFAAESHVDRSISDPSLFLKTNVLGTEAMLRISRQNDVKRFVHISTDEVYGSLGPEDDPFTEEHPLKPNSPYAAGKAGSDLIARAYYETYGFPVVITRCSNNYGPYQFPEKLIPLMITNAAQDIPLPVYGDGRNVRDWIYVDDHVNGVESVLNCGRIGEVYNLGGHCEIENSQVVRTILQIMGKPLSLIRYVPDRLGHDRRYAMDTGKIERELGRRPEHDFEQGLQLTVDWYLRKLSR